MANADDWREEFSEKSLADLRYSRDAGHVTGKEKLAVLAAVIREKEEAETAAVRQRQDAIDARLTTATEKSATAAARSCWATALAAVATLALVVIGGLQWQTAEKSSATLRSSNRAYVYFTGIELRPYPKPPDNVTVYGVTVIVTNSGNTPAVGLRVRSACPESSADFARDPFNLVEWSKETARSSMILGPKQTIKLQGCNLHPAQIENLKNGKSNIFAIVDVRYADKLSPENPRITQTARQLHFDEHGGYSFAFVGPHNCADADCAKLGNS